MSDHDSTATHAPVPPAQKAATLRRARNALFVLLLLMAAGAAVNVFYRVAQAKALESAAGQQATRYVSTVKAATGDAQSVLTLPATLQGQVEAPIYARSSGYLRRWTQDIGSPVKKGELLAELDTPEIDQQWSQAVAARTQVAASVELARTSQARWEALREKDAVSQQELDERRSALAQAQSNLSAADANVARLQQTRDFKRVLAPFDGVVTQRNVNVGDLIDAGAGASARGKPLFVVAQSTSLRAYVYVPQSQSLAVKPGQPVTIKLGELPGQAFAGKVARTAGAIDTATRTLQVEIEVPNADGKLLAGAYAQVTLPLGSAGGGLQLPTNTLMFRAEGTRLAVVDGDGVVHLRPVTLGRNYGAKIEIQSGVAAGEVVVLNPADSLADGDKVTVAAAASDASAASGAGAGKVGEPGASAAKVGA